MAEEGVGERQGTIVQFNFCGEREASSYEQGGKF